MAGMGQLVLRGPNAGPTCAQHIHPSLRQTPCVAMLKGLLFKFILANVCKAVPETEILPSSKFGLPNPKNRRRRPFAAVIKIRFFQPKRPVQYIDRASVRAFWLRNAGARRCLRFSLALPLPGHVELELRRSPRRPRGGDWGLQIFDGAGQPEAFQRKAHMCTPRPIAILEGHKRQFIAIATGLLRS
jgi:hypothetical protein